jgi:outer membrane protein assembly factor BamD
MRKLLVLALLLAVSGCGKKVQVKTPSITERDRELFESAMKFMEKSRWTAAQLDLQTLLAAYPDSEYAARAKYAYAEAFYRQGGSENMIQSDVAFKDFITFFPDDDLTDDAQMMVAMTHVKQLEKPDRDDTQARLAEYELMEMIKKYPDSQLSQEAKDKLREVQEVLAESIFGPAKQYFLRRAYPAVIDRCEEILMKYPDYSKTDRVLFQLAESMRQINDPESATYYAEIVRDYPLSERVQDAKKRLIELKSPVPDPNPAALDRQRKKTESQGGGVFGWLKLGTGKSGVSNDTSAASVKSKSGELSIERQK